MIHIDHNDKYRKNTKVAAATGRATEGCWCDENEILNIFKKYSINDKITYFGENYFIIKS